MTAKEYIQMLESEISRKEMEIVAIQDQIDLLRKSLEFIGE